MSSFTSQLSNDNDFNAQVETRSSVVDQEQFHKVSIEKKQIDSVLSLTEPLITNANSNERLETPTVERDNNEEYEEYNRLIDDYNIDADDVDRNLTRFGDDGNEFNILDSRRFGILAIFCLNNLMGSAIWITFATIEDAVKAKFGQYNHTTHGDASSHSGISNQQINWLAIIGMAVYAPGTAVCAWVVPKIGFRETVIVSSFVMAIGCFFRWLALGFILPNIKVGSNRFFTSELSYSFLLSGQGLVALGQTIFMNAPARVAATWFQQTTKIVGAINLFSNFGIVLGQALSPLFVEEETGEHLVQLVAAQGVAMGLCSLFTVCLFRYEEPAYPPSAAESSRRRERQRQRQHDSTIPILSTTSSILNDVRKLLSNSQYIILAVAFAINFGLNNAIFTLMQPWIASSGFPGDNMAGLCGSLFTGGGVIATWIASILLDRTRNFNSAIRWSFASTTVAGIGLVATLHPACPTWILATAFTITGMTQMPLTTICCDAVAAHTYPISEELSSAGLIMFGQYLGIILVDTMSYLIELVSNDEVNDTDDREEYGFIAKINIFYLSLLSFASTIACFYNSDDLRANVTNNREMLENSMDQITSSIGGSDHDDNSIDNRMRTIEVSDDEMNSEAT